jgi:hypothetical protein
MGRTTPQIVEFGRTGWANLFGAQFGIGQCGDLCECCLRELGGLAESGASLAMAEGHCQKPNPSANPP